MGKTINAPLVIKLSDKLFIANLNIWQIFGPCPFLHFKQQQNILNCPDVPVGEFER